MVWMMREGFQDSASRDGAEVGPRGCLWIPSLGGRDGGTGSRPSTPPLLLRISTGI